MGSSSSSVSSISSSSSQGSSASSLPAAASGIYIAWSKELLGKSYPYTARLIGDNIVGFTEIPAIDNTNQITTLNDQDVAGTGQYGPLVYSPPYQYPRLYIASGVANDRPAALFVTDAMNLFTFSDTGWTEDRLPSDTRVITACHGFDSSLQYTAGVYLSDGNISVVTGSMTP